MSIVGRGGTTDGGPATPLRTTSQRAATLGSASVSTLMLNRLLRISRWARNIGNPNSLRRTRGIDASPSCTWHTTGMRRQRARTSQSGCVIVLT